MGFKVFKIINILAETQHAKQSFTYVIASEWHTLYQRNIKIKISPEVHGTPYLGFYRHKGPSSPHDSSSQIFMVATIGLCNISLSSW